MLPSMGEAANQTVLPSAGARLGKQTIHNNI